MNLVYFPSKVRPDQTTRAAIMIKLYLLENWHHQHNSRQHLILKIPSSHDFFVVQIRFYNTPSQNTEYH